MKNFLAIAVLTALVCACNPQDSATSPPAGAAATPAEATSAPEEFQVVSWGPKSTPAGVAFNAQPDGNSGVFFELNQTVPTVAFTATLNGQPMTGVVASGKIVTATIPNTYLATPGSYPIVLEIPSLGTKIQAGTFEVTGSASPAAEAPKN